MSIGAPKKGGLDLMIGLLGKGKGSSSEDSSDDGGPERSYAKEAFAAMKDDDEDGFVEAFVSAVRACVKKADADEQEPDEDDKGDGYEKE